MLHRPSAYATTMEIGAIRRRGPAKKNRPPL